MVGTGGRRQRGQRILRAYEEQSALRSESHALIERIQRDDRAAQAARWEAVACSVLQLAACSL